MGMDTQAFLSLIEGDKDLAQELFRLYVEDWPPVLSQLEAAVSQGNGPEVEKSAHRLKGNMRNFFFTSGSSLAETIEQAGRENQLEGVADKLAPLKAALEELQGELQTFIDSLNK